MSIPRSGTYVLSIYALEEGNFEYPTGWEARWKFRINEGKNYSWTNVAVTFYDTVLTFTDANGEVHAISYAPNRTYGQKNYDYDSVIITSTNNPYRHYILSAEPADAIGAPQEIDYYISSHSWTLGPRIYSKDFPSSGFFDDSCFLENAGIATPDGWKPVQDIRPGDRIVTRVGQREEIDRVTWVGKARCVVRSGLQGDMSGAPVRIRADAFAPGVPSHDLLITPEHCVFCDGVFVPIRMLVNGLSILYETSFESYDYFHIETRQHSVIKANGLYTESYLDTGNRKSFSSEDGVYDLAGTTKSWDASAAAPLAVSQDIVKPLYLELQQRVLNRMFMRVPNCAFG